MMDKKTILERLSALEFAAVDLQLFLDTHPDNKEAIAKYNSLLDEAADVREQYESTFGPLFSFVTMSKADMFTWINNPWPWEKDFNTK